jgi:hypothetical protein
MSTGFIVSRTLHMRAQSLGYFFRGVIDDSFPVQAFHVHGITAVNDIRGDMIRIRQQIASPKEALGGEADARQVPEGSAREY